MLMGGGGGGGAAAGMWMSECVLAAINCLSFFLPCGCGCCWPAEQAKACSVFNENYYAISLGTHTRLRGDGCMAMCAPLGGGMPIQKRTIRWRIRVRGVWVNECGRLLTLRMYASFEFEFELEYTMKLRLSAYVYMCE